MASLLPTESVSTAASKLKGPASKTLRQLQGLTEPTTILGGGYFAVSVEDNTSDELDEYLDRQSSHHRYDTRVNPPVWVQTWKLDETDRAALQTAHAATVLHWHLVLSTWNRQGVFTRSAAQELAEFWEQDDSLGRIRFHKVSFVPDHVHIAVWVHPTVVPAELAVRTWPGSLTISPSSGEDSGGAGWEAVIEGRGCRRRIRSGPAFRRPGMRCRNRSLRWAC